MPSPARRTSTSSRTGSRRRTRTTAPCRTRARPAGSPAARAAARRRRSLRGDVELALGTDSGGSIRIPSAWCGIVGFKPTFDLVPADGCFPLAPSYDHVGPMASTVEGCIELMTALVPGFSAAELESLEELEVGVAWLERRGPARPRARRGGGVALPAPPDAGLPARRRRQPAVHARGRRRPPRTLPGERGRVRRQRPHEARALLRGDRRRGRRGATRARRVPRALRGGARRRRPARDADGRLRRAARRRRRS